jgi:hypothetical protein
VTAPAPSPKESTKRSHMVYGIPAVIVAGLALALVLTLALRKQPPVSGLTPGRTELLKEQAIVATVKGQQIKPGETVNMMISEDLDVSSLQPHTTPRPRSMNRVCAHRAPDGVLFVLIETYDGHHAESHGYLYVSSPTWVPPGRNEAARNLSVPRAQFWGFIMMGEKLRDHWFSITGSN